MVIALSTGTALATATNILTNALPDHWHWSRDLRIMGPVFALCVIATVWAGLFQHRQNNPERAGPGMSLQALADRLTSRYARDYRAWIREARRTMDAKGLDIIGPFSLELDAVMVRLVLTSRAPGQVSSGMVTSPGTTRRHRSIWEFLNRRPRVVLAVLGAPGSGKTTLLNHVARETASTYWERTRPIPVFLQLRDQAAPIAADPDVSLPALIRKSIPASVSAEPPGWWERQLRAGRCVILLDGLDEAGEAEVRRVVARWINTQIAAHPANDVVVTSRPPGYRGSFVEATATVQILPFGPSQVEEFLRKWYVAAEKHDAEPSELAGAERRGRKAAAHLLGQINTMPGLTDLTRNPLLLTMIANVHRYRDRLPENRAMLYREVCDVMVWRRAEQRDQPVAMSGNDRLQLLGRLAFEWMRQGIRGADRRSLLRTLRPWLAGVTPAMSAERFLDEMEATGLLPSPDAEHVTFTHQTFQEYLAARHITEEGMDGLLPEVVDDPWWRETILLHAADGNPNAIVAGALRSGTATARSLAFEIVDSGTPVDENLRTQLDEALQRGLRVGAAAQDRILAVDVLIGRLLRTLVSTSAGTRIMRQPVTTELYQLFCSETGTPFIEGPEPPNPEAPARGVWRRDAERFVSWLNELIRSGPRGAGGLTFRLPTGTEVEAVKPIRPVWVTDGRISRVWRNRLIVDADSLAEVLMTELEGSRLLSIALGELAARNAATIHRHAVDLHRIADQLALVAGEYVRWGLRADPERTDEPSTADGVAGVESPSEEDILLERADFMTAHLSGLVREIRRAANSLKTILTTAPGIEAPAALRVSGVLDRIDLAPAQRRVDAAIADMPHRNPRMTDVHTALRNILTVLARCRSLLREDHAPVTGASPIDRALSPISYADVHLPLPDRADDPVRTIALALLPKRQVEENAFAVDLSGLAARLRAMSGRRAFAAAGPGYSEALGRLVATAIPVLNRERLITPDVARNLRVPALVLARIAQTTIDNSITTNLIELAVATRLLEERRRYPDLLETLFIAHD
ncbi:NACHT domain-containing protein [Actinoplanes subglobosus]|uniref:NACHT domain-containing protein n=1 Tax=Actinoplanes subglobosus TaxID=1547892 RepID=A0ABV8J310_9ACTN